METVFICGNIEEPDYITKFARASAKLWDKGYKILNPATLPPDLTHDQRVHITRSMLEVSDKVYFMRGWNESSVSSKEYTFAALLDKKAIFEEESA
jgi:hypothetical protein